MAPPVEAKTIFVPCLRAASSTCSVPTTFTSASKSGRSTDTRTSACAARWKQTSGRTSSKTRPASLRMSASWTRTPAATFSGLPLEKSSSTCTSAPRASSASTTCEPMKPAPPVTTARTRRIVRTAVFVTFEGLDGSGKTTQSELLAEALRAEGHDVVSDRYVDSSLAYQGHARDLGIEEVSELNRVATRGLLPDVTFVLEVDPDTSAARVGQSPDRIEREGREFRQRVLDGYRIVAGKYPSRVILVDGTRPPAELHEEIRGRLREHF